MARPLRPPLEDADFGEEYYRLGVGRPYRKDQHWLRFFTPIADRIVSEIKPRRVLDAGCALGILVELLRERGVEAYGFDISSYAIAHVPEPVRPFCWRASVTDELSEDYDLILCQEVFPHVAPSSAEAAIANFCRHTRDVLFSSPPLIDREVRRHVNFDPPGHFAAVFARHGFYRDFTCDASFVTPWAVRYRQGAGDDVSAVIGEYERHLWAQRLRFDEAREGLAQAQDRMARMESSWFWRARKPWAKLTGR